MADPLAPRFEHEALEADIERLALEVKAQREHPETKSLQGPELLKRSLQLYTGTVSVPPAPNLPAAKAPLLPSYMQNASSEVKLEVEYLVDMAFHEGVIKANEEARKSSSFVVDAFHDALVGKLYPEFKRRGLID